MRISDWSSDVCSSDLLEQLALRPQRHEPARQQILRILPRTRRLLRRRPAQCDGYGRLSLLTGSEAIASQSQHCARGAMSRAVQNLRGARARDIAARAFAAVPLNYAVRSEEHTSELPSLMRTSYAAFILIN